MSELFQPLTLRGTTLRNRAWVSPMCQYSAVDGLPQDWHLVHLGGFAVGGAGLVLSEATAVVPQGRISPADTGIWNDEQVEQWRRITEFIRSQKGVPGIQLAHAGRKASTAPPFEGRGPVSPEDGGWPDIAAPSAVAFDGLPEPHAMTVPEIRSTVAAFRDGAVRAFAAGFEVVEIHAAHGYLLHSFLSPLSNQRNDLYGGTFDNRARMVLEVVDAVRSVWPERQPLLLRLSSTDWVEGGWDIDQTVELAGRLKHHGVDMVDCSSGGISPDVQIPVAPGYQVPFSARVRREAGIPAGAVGLITEPGQAEKVIAAGDADAVLLARALLRDPHWTLRAAHELGADVHWAPQYERARWR